MKKFFRDYWELCKESGVFMKKHWFGTLIFSGTLGLIGAVITETILEPEWPMYLWEKIRDVYTGIFHKNSDFEV